MDSNLHIFESLSYFLKSRGKGSKAVKTNSPKRRVSNPKGINIYTHMGEISFILLLK